MPETGPASGPADPVPPVSPAPADRVALVVATVGGAGYSPIAPGTAGSLLTAVVLALVPFTRSALVLFFAAVTVAGLWAAGRAERVLGRKDPSVIVVDEAAGMTLAVLAVPLTPAVLVVAFVLFRVFDIVKPFPADASQRLGGGLGVMADDLIAGLYALLVVLVLRAAFGWPA